MDEKAGIILRNLLLDSLETYKEEKENADFENEFYELLGKSIKKAKEGFLDSGLMDPDYYHGNDPDTFEYFLAPVYAVELCSLIPDVSERATKLLSKVTIKDIDGITEKYMEEANKCYIYGFFLAAAIVCRGAIEYSLKKYLGKDKVTNPHPIFYQLSDEACKRRLIDKKEMDALNKMYWAESECIHGKKQIESDECLEYINLTKSVISKLL